MIIILTARWCYFRHYQPAYPYPALFHVIHHLKYSAHVILILMRQHHSIKASDTAVLKVWDYLVFAHVLFGGTSAVYQYVLPLT